MVDMVDMEMELRTFGQAIAHIDLESGETAIRPVPADWVKKYIGARGLGVRSP